MSDSTKDNILRLTDYSGGEAAHWTPEQMLRDVLATHPDTMKKAILTIIDDKGRVTYYAAGTRNLLETKGLAALTVDLITAQTFIEE